MGDCSGLVCCSRSPATGAKPDAGTLDEERALSESMRDTRPMRRRGKSTSAKLNLDRFKYDLTTEARDLITYGITSISVWMLMASLGRLGSIWAIKYCYHIVKGSGKLLLFYFIITLLEILFDPASTSDIIFHVVDVKCQLMLEYIQQASNREASDTFATFTMHIYPCVIQYNHSIAPSTITASRTLPSRNGCQ